MGGGTPPFPTRRTLHAGDGSLLLGNSVWQSREMEDTPLGYGDGYPGTFSARLVEDGKEARRAPRGSLRGAEPPFTAHHLSPTLFLLVPSGSHYTPAHGLGGGGQMDRRGL